MVVSTTAYSYVTTPRVSEGAVNGSTVEPIGLQEWTPQELKILGAFLWLASIVSVIGNLSCFYAVLKNIKKIMEHPFFQSNIFCIILSVVDVLIVVLVGIPAAVAYTSFSTELSNGYYNLAWSEPILDYLIWVQLMIILAICADRCGHICRPLTYTFSIKASKAALACCICLLLPFIGLTLPNLILVNRVTGYWAKLGGALDNSEQFVKDMSFKCKSFTYQDRLIHIFMTCTLQINKDDTGSVAFIWWENIIQPVAMFLAILALMISNAIIIKKLLESASFQKNNEKRQQEVERSVRINSLVSIVQAVLLVICTLPMRIQQIEKRLEALEDCEELKGGKCLFDAQKYSHHYLVITRALVVLGPVFNPWLYPIRMASIRSFLVIKKKSVVSSVNTSLSRIRTRHTVVVSKDNKINAESEI